METRVKVECEGEYMFDEALKKYVPNGLCSFSYLHEEEDATEEENRKH